MLKGIIIFIFAFYIHASETIFLFSKISDIVSDSSIQEEFEEQLNNYYDNDIKSDDMPISMLSIEEDDNKLKLFKLLSDNGVLNKKSIKRLIRKNKELEDELNNIANSKFTLLVSIKKTKNKREELRIEIKKGGALALGEEYVIPINVTDRQSLIKSTIIASIFQVLSTENKNFMDYNQL